MAILSTTDPPVGGIGVVVVRGRPEFPPFQFWRHGASGTPFLTPNGCAGPQTASAARTASTRSRGPVRPGGGSSRRGRRRCRAASSYEQPSTWVSTNASRRSAGRPSTSSRGRPPLAASDATSTAAGCAFTRALSKRSTRVVAHRVGAGPAGDGEQPGAGRRLAAERGQRLHARTYMSWVTSSASSGADQMAGQAPHLGLRGAHERRAARRGRRLRASVRRAVRSSTARATILGNQTAAGSDYLRMDCTDARTAISARLDGEDRSSWRAPRCHISRRAPTAAASGTSATTMHRRLRLRPAEPVPDLSPRSSRRSRSGPADDGRIGGPARRPRRGGDGPDPDRAPGPAPGRRRRAARAHGPPPRLVRGGARHRVPRRRVAAGARRRRAARSPPRSCSA